jgi:hypothetical protein
MVIRDNPKVSHFFDMTGDSNFLHLNGCVIETPSKIAVGGSFIGKLKSSGCVDLNGIPVSLTRGNWTPQLLINNSEDGITYASRAGRYFVDEGLVTLSFDITLTSKGAGVGNVTIGGLPIGVAPGAGPRLGSASIAVGGSLPHDGLLIARATSTGGGTIQIRQQSTTSWPEVNNTQITDTTRITALVTYEANFA